MKNKNIISGVFALAVLLSVGLGCSQHGTKLETDGGNLYYTTNVTKIEAQDLLDYLVQENFYGGQNMFIQLDKSGSSYQFRLIVKPEYQNDKSYREACKLFAEELSSNVFNDASVEVHICDDNFETIRVVKP